MTMMAFPPRFKPKHCRYPVVPNPWGLTAMETAVLSSYLEGRTQQETAEALCIAQKTVSTYIARAKDAMEVATSHMAVVLWDRFSRGAKPADFEIVVRVVDGKPTSELRGLTEEGGFTPGTNDPFGNKSYVGSPGGDGLTVDGVYTAAQLRRLARYQESFS